MNVYPHRKTEEKQIIFIYRYRTLAREASTQKVQSRQKKITTKIVPSQ